MYRKAAKKKGFARRFFNAFNVGFTTMTNRYKRSIDFLIRRRWVAIGGLVLIAAVTVLLIKTTPTGFIPTEDQGFILYAVNTPPGSSLDRTHEATVKIDSVLKHYPSVFKKYTIDGLNFISNANASEYAAGFIRLKPYKERGDVKDAKPVKPFYDAGGKQCERWQYFLLHVSNYTGLW